MSWRRSGARRPRAASPPPAAPASSASPPSSPRKGSTATSRAPGWLYTENPDDAQRIDEEVEAARKLGVEAARDDRPGLPFDAAAAVRFADQARFHPVA